MQHKWLVLLGLATLLALPGRGASPRINLSLQQVTLPEAADALSRASGVNIQAGSEQSLPDPFNSQRETFEWRQITLSNALRDLCSRFDLSARRDGETEYRLFHNYGRTPGPPAIDVGLVDDRGLRLAVGAISTESTRSLTLEGEDGGPSTGETRITFTCRS